MYSWDHINTPTVYITSPKEAANRKKVAITAIAGTAIAIDARSRYTSDSTLTKDFESNQAITEISFL